MRKCKKKVNRPLATNQYLGLYIGQDVLFCLIYFVCIHPIIHQMQTTKQILIVDLRKFES